MKNFITYAIIMKAPTRLEDRDIVIMYGDNEEDINSHFKDLQRDYPDRDFQLFCSKPEDGEEEEVFKGKIPQECPDCGEAIYKQCIPSVSGDEFHAEVLYECGSVYRIHKSGDILTTFRSGYCYTGEIQKLEAQIEELKGNSRCPHY